MFGIVIDENGYKTQFVCLNEKGNVLYYELKTGESIITFGWDIANSMCKPHWTGTEWEDLEPPEENKIDICEKDRVKTNEELTEEQIKMQKIIADLEIESIINN